MAVKEIMGIKVHPAANAFPLLTGKAFNDLVKSIEKNGMRTPIMVLHSPHLKQLPLLVVDGRNRLRAWEKLYKAGKVKKDAWLEDAYYASELCNPNDDLQIKRLVYDLNIHRRHLTEDMKSMAAELLFGDEIRNGKKDKGGRPSKKLDTKRCPVSRDTKKKHANSSEGQLAEKAGTSHRSIRRAAKIRAAEGKHPAVPKGTSQKIANGEIDAKEIEKKIKTTTGTASVKTKTSKAKPKKNASAKPVTKSTKSQLREDLLGLVADWKNADHSLTELKALLLKLAARCD